VPRTGHLALVENTRTDKKHIGDEKRWIIKNRDSGKKPVYLPGRRGNAAPVFRGSLSC